MIKSWFVRNAMKRRFHVARWTRISPFENDVNALLNRGIIRVWSIEWFGWRIRDGNLRYFAAWRSCHALKTKAYFVIIVDQRRLATSKAFMRRQRAKGQNYEELESDLQKNDRSHKLTSDIFHQWCAAKRPTAIASSWLNDWSSIIDSLTTLDLRPATEPNFKPKVAGLWYLHLLNGKPCVLWWFRTLPFPLEPPHLLV